LAEGRLDHPTILEFADHRGERLLAEEPAASQRDGRDKRWRHGS
jgi:hypothetical protein